MITAGLNANHMIYVMFNDFPALSFNEAGHWQAKIRIQEAGFGFKDGGLTTIISRSWQEDGKFIKNLTMSESMHCDPHTLAGAALALDRDQLVDLLTEAFDVYQQAIKAYEEEVETYRKAAGARRGRPPLANQGEKRDAFVGANVSADLKKWAENQPGGVSALINELLLAERERRLLQESPKHA